MDFHIADWGGHLLAIALFVATVTLLRYRSSRNRRIVLQDIIYYPIKSCAGVYVSEAEVTDTGLAFDRHWAICDPQFNIITQAEEPKLRHIRPRLILRGDSTEIEALVIRYQDQEFTLKYEADLRDVREVVVWRVPVTVGIESPEAAKWLSAALGKEYILVRRTGDRGIHAEFWQGTPEKMSLAEGTQLLLTSVESLSALVQQLPQGKREIEMEAFRPNLVVANCLLFEEDTFASFSINSVQFRGVKACRRCKVTSLHPATLEFDSENEPNSTLRRIHSRKDLALFGTWCMRSSNGTVRVGQEVTVTRRMEIRA